MRETRLRRSSRSLSLSLSLSLSIPFFVVIVRIYSDARGARGVYVYTLSAGGRFHFIMTELGQLKLREFRSCLAKHWYNFADFVIGFTLKQCKY